ncbi:5,10-methylene-tetrahydrofolate dehydrogenase/methenyl tetrahydrofolate cyclohydrolase/GNAT superfamily N-acetyltransferase [Paenibacillus baekrokdamisoli]|nr:5,10-methylene-tetrahydrofolate dehydrogenase/methenyl tetrahydrofolate cyclohydrolase/GNAT superfamily N-acetyltransferase [Paenibacillus baekrokdamisoli]
MNAEKRTIILNGLPVAERIKEGLRQQVEKLTQRGVIPCLATILVGDDLASETYVRMKGNACRKLGIDSKRILLDKGISTDELIKVIEQLNGDSAIHGILLQHPVPSHIDERAAFEAICIDKDVDGVTTLGFAQNAFGFAQFPSCTPAAIMSILEDYEIPVEGKHAVVIGRSPILGKPVAMMLLNKHATVTICHSKTTDLAAIVRSGDIIVAAVGRARFVQADWIKPGAVILDAGYNAGNVGDVDYDACEPIASAITPVPAGVGPITIATLLKHTVEAAERLSLIKPITIDVKRAAIEESSDVLQLWKGSAQWLQSKGINQWDPDFFRIEQIHESFQDGSEIYIARLNGELVGTLQIWWSDPEVWEALDDQESGYIHRFAVSRNHGGLGIGSLLLDWAETYIRSKGKHQVRLDCMATNERLNQYYLDNGYQPRGVKVWGNGWKSNLFWLTINVLLSYLKELHVHSPVGREDKF